MLEVITVYKEGVDHVRHKEDLERGKAPVTVTLTVGKEKEICSLSPYELGLDMQ